MVERSPAAPGKPTLDFGSRSDRGEQRGDRHRDGEQQRSMKRKSGLGGGGGGRMGIQSVLSRSRKA